jgi:hypothetical protein
LPFFHKEKLPVFPPADETNENSANTEFGCPTFITEFFVEENFSDDFFREFAARVGTAGHTPTTREPVSGGVLHVLFLRHPLEVSPVVVPLVTVFVVHLWLVVGIRDERTGD